MNNLVETTDKTVTIKNGSTVNCEICWVAPGGRRILPKHDPDSPAGRNRAAVPYHAPSPEAAQQIAEHHRLSTGHQTRLAGTFVA